MTKFCKKLKSPILGPFLTIFGHYYQKRIFLLKHLAVTHNSTRTPNPMPIIRKTKVEIPRKPKLIERQKDRQMNEQKDRQVKA